MGRTVLIALIVFGVIATFALFGFSNTATSQLINAIGYNSPESLKGFELFKLLFNSNAGIIASILGGAAIVVGLFRSSSPIEYVIAGFVGLLVGWVIGDLVTIIGLFNSIGAEFSWVSSIAKILLMGMVLTFILSAVQWWRGSD